MTPLDTILQYYKTHSRVLNNTQHSRGAITPYMKVKNKADWEQMVVLTTQSGVYEKAWSKETFYRDPKVIALLTVPGFNGLKLVPSVTRPKRCYAFQHSYPYYNFPRCVYEVFVNRQDVLPTGVITHLSEYNKVKGVTYNNHTMKDFRIEFFYGFETTPEGREVRNLYNFRKNSNEYLLSQVIHKVTEIQGWSGREFIQISEI